MLTDADLALDQANPAPVVKASPTASVAAAQAAPPEPQEVKLKTNTQPAEVEVAPPVSKPTAESTTVPTELVTPMPAEPVPQGATVNPVAAQPAASADASWQTALYTQQMAHQLAMAELRNQHLQEQQRLMQQMLDLMQRQLVR
ncbi:hypothetical protein [uncultured Hymenobacter sp.]|uniref:hypothetical protein n=1 Tax=uncultured Hymenobacter sp. TaxID=170016 RepID=UPI0035CBF124